MQAPVHDEIVGDLDDPAMAQGMGEILNRQTSPLAVPILWETRVGPTWHHAH